MRSFRKQVFQGVFWMGSLRVVDRLLSLLKTIILARILFPADFGRFGITLLTLSLLETFSETGFRQALIQKPRDIKNDLPSAWLVFFIRGATISTLLVISAPFISYFFQEDVRQLMYLLALVPFVRGLTNPAVVFFQRKLQFQKEFTFRSVTVFTEVTVGVISALILRSAWALVLAVLAGALSELILSLIIAPLPRGTINLKRIRRLFLFGRWITGSSILSYLTDQGDDLVVGKVLGAHFLGLYQTAFRVGLLPTTQVAGMFSQISLPILSRLPPKKRFAKTVTLAWTSAYPAFLLGGILVLFAQELVKMVLGERWLPMVGTLRIIAVFGMVRSIGSVLTTYFVSQGRPKINTLLNLLKLTIIALGIFPAVKIWGIEGVALVIMLSGLIASSTAFLLLIREGDKRKLFGELAKPLGVLVLTVGLSFAIKPVLRLFSLGVYLLSFMAAALLIDKHLRDLLEQELLPRLPQKVKEFYIQQKVIFTKRRWFDRHWRERSLRSTLKEWQKTYDLKWQYEPEDSISLEDIKWIERHLRRVEAKTVLDVGSGSGKLAVALAKQGYRVIACDVSLRALRLGQEKAKRQGVGRKIRWLQARLENLPLRNDCVDVCLASHVLEHVGDLKKAVKEIKRVAKKAVVVIVPVEEKRKIIVNYHLQFFSTENQLIKTMGLSSFETERVVPKGKDGFFKGEIIRYWGEK